MENSERRREGGREGEEERGGRGGERGERESCVSILHTPD